MNAQEKYLFDLGGYINVKNVLSADELEELNTLIDEQAYGAPKDDSIHSQRFGGFLNWENDAFRRLPQPSPYHAVLAEIVGPKFRLDHVYGILMQEGQPWRHATRRRHTV